MAKRSSKAKRRSPPEARPPSEWLLPRPWIWVVLAAGWAGLGLFYYTRPHLWPSWRVFRFLRFAPPDAGQLGEYIVSVSAFLWLLAAGLASGAYALRRLGFRFHNRWEAAGLSLAAGWGGTALVILALGLLGLWRVWLVYGLLAVWSVFLAAKWRAVLEPFRSEEPPWTASEKALAGALALLAGACFVGTFIPEFFYDALVYHLALPKIFWRHHGLVATPWNLYSGIPSLVEMLYAAVYPLGGVSSAHMVHWSLWGAAAVLIVGLGTRFWGRRAGLTGAVIFYCCPLACILSWKGAIELGWTFFQLASICALAIRCADGEESPGGRLRWTLLSAFLCGLTMGCKYPAWPFAGAALALLVHHLIRVEKAPREAWSREAGLWLAVCAAAVCLWPAKNVLFYGNPVYPFLNSWFGGETGPNIRELVSASGGGRNPLHILGSWDGLRSYLMHPWSLLAAKPDDMSCVGPLFLLGLLPLLLMRAPDRAYRLVRAALLLLWGVWSLGTVLVRYFLPQTALAAALFGLAVDRLPPRGRRLAWAGLAFVVVSNFVWSLAWFGTYQGDRVVSGLMSRRQYLSEARPSYVRPAYRAIEWVNENAPETARVMFVGEARAFHIDRDYFAPTIHDKHPLEGWIRDSRSIDELLGRFRGAGVTHAVFNPAEMFVWQGKGNRYLPSMPDKKALYRDFSKTHLRPVFRDKKGDPSELRWAWTAVFELVEGAGGGAPPGP